MISIFYRNDGKLMVSQSETELNRLNINDVVWIDLFAPESAEKHFRIIDY